MTQKQRVLDLLHEGPVCSFQFYYTPGLTHRLGARIYDLRQDGHQIITRPCDLGHNHEAPAVVYELVTDPQLSLL